MPSFLAPECAALLRGMLALDPNDRFLVQDVFDNAWFSKGLKPGVLGYNDKLVANNLANPPVDEAKMQQIRVVLAEASRGSGNLDDLEAAASANAAGK